jgi:hypothetical protein
MEQISKFQCFLDRKTLALLIPPWRLSGMAEDLGEIISEKEAEFRILGERMESFRLRFIADSIFFARKWFEETTKLYVLRYPEIALSMNEKTLAQMKNMVKDLVRNADRIMKEALSDRGIWWNLEPRRNESRSLYEQLGDEKVGSKFPEAVDRPIRRALGELGIILEKFGYKVTVNVAYAASYPEYWFENIENKGGSCPYFPHLLEWSEPMKFSLQQYESLYKFALELFNEIERLKSEKKKQEANRRWDLT